MLVIDIGLPDTDGRDLCQALRARGIQTPVLFLTARDALVDRVAGFDAGGDDYVAKPFALVELVARLQALVRRGGADGCGRGRRPPARPVCRTRSASAGVEVPLTPTEFRLLARLLSRPGEAVRRRDLVRAGWPHGAIVRENTLDAYVARLRTQAARARRRARDRHRARRRLPRPVKPLGIRRRLLLAVVAWSPSPSRRCSLGFNVLLQSTLDKSSKDLLRSRAAEQIASLRAEGGELTVLEAPDDAARKRSLGVLAGARCSSSRAPAPGSTRSLTGWPAARSASSMSRTPTPGSTPLRSSSADGASGQSWSAGSLAPYEETRRVALVASLVFGGLVLILVAVAARWLLASSLRPVRRMTRQAATWSERDLDQRFAVGEPYDELTELAATLDGLLDRLAASLRHEQRFSAELSHELRTPLARVLAEVRARAAP